MGVQESMAKGLGVLLGGVAGEADPQGPVDHPGGKTHGLQHVAPAAPAAGGAFGYEDPRASR